MSKSLNRVIVEEYLKDLRSGNFEQCRLELHSENGKHCAIGIFELTYTRITGEPFNTDVQEVYNKFRKLVQIRSDNIWAKNDGVYPEKSKWSFSEIADYIEENSPVMEKVG